MGIKSVKAADIKSAEGELLVVAHRLKKLRDSRWRHGVDAETAALDKWDDENEATLQATIAAVRAAEERLRKLQVTRSQLVNRSRVGTQVVEWAALAWTLPVVFTPTGRRGVIEVADGVPVNGKRRCRYFAGDLVVRLLRKDLSLSMVVVRLDSAWIEAGVRHKRTAVKVVKFSDYEPVTVKSVVVKHGNKTAES